MPTQFPAEDYLETGLPMFDDPDVVAVAGHASTTWDREDRLGLLGQVLRAYRERVYVAFQVLLKYGQAARHADSVMIVPGFASMYRTRILEFIDIAAPGLAIEDFNMTFEVHRKRLGRVAFHPGSATAYTQDPHILKDYVKQVGRWSLGFWQTVRRHGLHRGRFWVATAAYILELLTSSILFVLLGPALLLTLVAVTWVGVHGVHGPVDEAFVGITSALPPHDYLLGVVVPDFLLTIFVAIRQRRPAYLLLGLAFLPLRCLDAVLCLRSLWRSRSAQSAGTWTGPTRRGAAPVAVDSAPTVMMAAVPAQVSRRGAAPTRVAQPARVTAPTRVAHPVRVTVPAQRAASTLLDAPTVVLPRVGYAGQPWLSVESDATQPIALPLRPPAQHRAADLRTR